MLETQTTARHLDEPGESFANEAEERAYADRIRAGDVVAFEALYRTYWLPLYTFAFRYLQTKEDAEEAVQNVFFRIWRGRADWRPVGPIRNYLFLAVRNSARDQLRHCAVARLWQEGQVSTLSDRARAATHNVEAALESADLSAAVERALAALPRARRAVCTLRLIDQLSYAQIAERLGISVKTVENQLANGLKFLRGQLRNPL